MSDKKTLEIGIKIDGRSLEEQLGEMQRRIQKFSTVDAQSGASSKGRAGGFSEGTSEAMRSATIRHEQKLNEILRERYRLLNDMHTKNQQQQQINAKGPAGFGGGVGSGGGASGSQAAQVANAMGVILGGANEIYKTIYRSPLVAQMSGGAATQNSIGREISNTYSGRGTFEQAWRPEKLNASNMASAISKGDIRTDIAKIVIGAVVGGVGAASMAMSGGMTAPGVVAVMGGLASMGGSDRTRAMLLGQNGQYEAMTAENKAKYVQQSLAGQKELNPFKNETSKWYEANWGRNLNAQRAMGLSNSDLTDFLGEAAGAGFNDSSAMGAYQGILGSGGSTRMARGSTAALQAERGLGLTNASSIFGSLSGGLGDAGISEQAMRKIFSVAAKIRLDDKDYVQEKRMFMQLASDIVATSGARTGAEAGMVANTFGNSVAENTTQGLNAAKSAYEDFQKFSGSTEGARGGLRISSMMRHPLLGRLDAKSLKAFSMIQENQLTPSNEVVQSLAGKLGVLPADLIAAGRESLSQSENVYSETDEMRNNLKGMSPADARYKMAHADFITQLSLDSGESDPRKLQSKASRQLGSSMPFWLGTEDQNIKDRMTNKNTGISGDKTMQGMAEDTKMVLQNFTEMRDVLVPAAESVRVINERLQELVKIGDAIKDPAAKAKWYTDNLGFLNSASQTQSSVNTPGQ